jgi:hypothetical protein
MNTTQFALDVVEDVPKTVQRRSVPAQFVLKDMF